MDNSWRSIKHKVIRQHGFNLLVVIVLMTFLPVAQAISQNCDCTSSTASSACKEACEEARKAQTSISWRSTLQTVGQVASVAGSVFGVYAAFQGYQQNNARHAAYMEAAQNQQKANYRISDGSDNNDDDWGWVAPLIGMGVQALFAN